MHIKIIKHINTITENHNKYYAIILINYKSDPI